MNSFRPDPHDQSGGGLVAGPPTPAEPDAFDSGAERASWFQTAPLVVVLALFFGLPMLVVVAVSFFDFDRTDIIPTFILDNYVDLFRSEVTLRLYASSIKFALIVWAVTLVLGFNVAYFLVFHVRGVLWQIGLFLVCTVPFLTSNIIRMISWIPFLGRNGIFNQALQGAGITSQPLEFLLFSDFAVVVAYVHLFTLFMVVPIFNSMARIDKSLLEAARDAGAGRFRAVAEIVLPLSKSGIALGSIFVITLVMGDSFVLRTMSGGQSASVVSALQNEVAALQYPPAAASAVIMVIIVTLMVAGILRLVDVRKELAR
jgi:putative spermidine/putrescine transport system permease protein